MFVCVCAVACMPGLFAVIVVELLLAREVVVLKSGFVALSHANRTLERGRLGAHLLPLGALVVRAAELGLVAGALVEAEHATRRLVVHKPAVLTRIHALEILEAGLEWLPIGACHLDCHRKHYQPCVGERTFSLRHFHCVVVNRFVVSCQLDRIVFSSSSSSSFSTTKMTSFYIYIYILGF